MVAHSASVVLSPGAVVLWVLVVLLLPYVPPYMIARSRHFGDALCEVATISLNTIDLFTDHSVTRRTVLQEEFCQGTCRSKRSVSMVLLAHIDELYLFYATDLWCRGPTR